MAIFRREGLPVDNYVIIPNCMARDHNISPVAKTLYMYMCSHNDGWSMSTERMAKAIGVSHATAKRAIKELDDRGYLKREKARGKDGRMSETEYILTTPPGIKNVPVETTSNDDVFVQVGTTDQKTTHGEMIPHKKTNYFKKKKEKRRLSDPWYSRPDTLQTEGE